MTLEHLDGNDRRVFQLIVGHFAMENLESSVITRISEQGQPTLVETDGPYCLAVEPHCLVWPVRQVKVMPEQPLIIAADD